MYIHICIYIYYILYNCVYIYIIYIYIYTYFTKVVLMKELFASEILLNKNKK